ncbi:MAG: heavy metal translocating P-type ATPase metal-binding domain-containing protein [Planctomycetota bacterium]
MSTATAPPTSAPMLCKHCGLPSTQTFCCNGCRGAYELIQGWGLDSYYQLRDSGQTQATRETHEDAFAVFDDPEYLGRSAPQTTEDGLAHTQLTVIGLHCAACVWLIESVATRTPGWNDARVRMNDHSIRIAFDPARTQLSRIAKQLSRIGYELSPQTTSGDDAFTMENRQLLTRIAIAGFCAANAMWIAIALYAGDATGLADDHRLYLRWFGTALGVAAVVFPGRTFFVGALAALKNRTPHMDMPVALGLAVGTIAGIAGLLSGRGDVYFDSLAVLVFLLLVGRWLQFRSQHRAAKTVELMLHVTPRHARRLLPNGEESLVPTDHLRIGDSIRVRAGESIPADGTLESQRAKLDRSLLSGESAAVDVDQGDLIEAGATNLTQEIQLRVTAIGKDSRIGRVMESVAEAAGQKTPLVQLADRIGGVFVVVVTLAALGTFAWWFASDPVDAASHATSLLIVACPCALALATPLAIAVAAGTLAKRKIFVRDGASLSRLAKPGTIWFDKTGTLTLGRPRATWVHGDRQALALAAAIETENAHPIARAIVDLANDVDPANDVDLASGVDRSNDEDSASPTTKRTTNVKTQHGGVSGEVDQHQVWVGNPGFIIDQGGRISAADAAAIARTLSGQSTPILIAIDGEVKGLIAISDAIKPNAAALVKRLQRTGWNVAMLSGDDPAVVTRVGNELGIAPESCLGGLSPEQKLQTVRQSVCRTKVMVGDGVNDAAALAAADVGIAVRGGAEVSLRAAPVFVAETSLAAIATLLDASRRTTLLVFFAILTSLSYNLVAVALAMSGQISPLIAAILMPISSVSVLSLCLFWPIARGNALPQ